MYGMVNKAIEGMVVEEAGGAIWRTILDQAGLADEIFISNEAYPDEVTYRLVTVSSEVLNRSMNDILEDFGIYWVMKVARVEYGDLMSLQGMGIGEFLDHLPNFHSRLEMIFPNFKPPRFEVSGRQPGSLILHYHTHREGLAPFVVGIIKGLGQFYETAVTVEHIHDRGSTDDHDQFRISWQE
jgi:hypothetical protein